MRKVRAVSVGRSSAIAAQPTGPAMLVRVLAIADVLVVALTLAYFTSSELLGAWPSRFWLALCIPVYQALFQLSGLYQSHRLQGAAGVLRPLATAELVGVNLVAFGALPLSGLAALPAILKFAAVNTALLACGRLAIYTLLRYARRHGHDRRHICVIGTWQRADEIAGVLAGHPEWGMTVSVAGIASGDGSHRFLSYPDAEEIAADLGSVLSSRVVDEVVIAVKPEHLAAERATVEACEVHGVLGRVMLDYATGESDAALPDAITSKLVMDGGEEHNGERVFLKRVVDVVGACLGLVGAGPAMLLIATLIRLSSPGPAIFRQRRAGRNGRVFTIYKGRTMVEGADAMMMPATSSITKGPIFKSTEDFRITPIGHFLRRYSLDELPQFFNVLKGDMSLVGPRPLPLKEASAIQGIHRRRFRVLPGLTGIWQVSGRSDVEFERWMEYDLEYIDNWSLGLDLKVLMKTAHVVLTGKGAY